jgi:hypothetical protein
MRVFHCLWHCLSQTPSNRSLLWLPYLQISTLNISTWISLNPQRGQCIIPWWCVHCSSIWDLHQYHSTFKWWKKKSLFSDVHQWLIF